MDYPRITIVTPSFNQVDFIEQTILSVIGQGYPNLEYIVIDGGSTDGSREVIKRYQQHLAYWTSEKDLGQSNAINKGFSRATGEILGWLNSDDMYLPGTLHYVGSQLSERRAELLFGNCFHFVENRPNSWGSDVREAHNSLELALCDYIIQPASFWTRDAWELTGDLDEALHFGFDWDWFIRARNAAVAFKPDDRYLAVYRVHDAHKTGTGGNRRLSELCSIYRRYAGTEYEKIFSELCDQRTRVTSVRRWIQRAHVRRWEASVYKLAFPQLLLRQDPKKVKSLVAMIW